MPIGKYEDEEQQLAGDARRAQPLRARAQQMRGKVLDDANRKLAVQLFNGAMIVSATVLAAVTVRVVGLNLGWWPCSNSRAAPPGGAGTRRRP